MALRTPGTTDRAVSVCYEYLEEIMKTLPSENAPMGITRSDAMIGQFFYVFAHEFGHAAFDIFAMPIFGNEEDAADQFATYVMLQFGKDDARRLITGAAFAYERYVQNPEVSAPLAAFSDVHAPPAQRYFNMLCLAYGANEALFADVVERGYLPKTRAKKLQARIRSGGVCISRSRHTASGPAACEASPGQGVARPGSRTHHAEMKRSGRCRLRVGPRAQDLCRRDAP